MSNLARSLFDRCHTRLLNLSPRLGRSARLGLLSSFAVLAALMMGTVAFTANLGLGPVATLFGTAVTEPQPEPTPPGEEIPLEGKSPLPDVPYGPVDVKVDVADLDPEAAAMAAFHAAGGSPFPAPGPGNSTSEITTGFLNAGTKPDVIVSNYFDSSISVYQIDTFGSLFSRADIALDAGGEPFAVEFGNINGDANPDVVVVNRATNSIQLLLGDGAAGTDFSSIGTPFLYGGGVNPGPRGMDVGDLNGDGRDDIVVTNFNNGTISIKLNNAAPAPAGVFNTETLLTVGGQPFYVILEDFDGDTDLDIAYTDFVGAQVGFLQNTGAGAFAALPTFVGVGTNPSGLTAVNVDGPTDMDLDVVVANRGSNNVSVLQNNGAGTFAVVQTVGTAAAQPNGIDAADFNNDGDPDLVLTSFTAGTNASVLMGVVGSPMFKASFTVGTGGTFGVGAEALSVDGDSAPDFLITNSGTNTVAVLLNNNPIINGTAMDDTFIVCSVGGTTTEVRTGNACGAGTLIYSQPTATMESLRINGLDGNDTLTIDSGGGNPYPTMGSATRAIFFDGGTEMAPTPAGFDQVFRQGAAQQQCDSTPSGPASGNIVCGTNGLATVQSFFTYSGLEPIVDNNFVTNFFINGTAGVDTINIIPTPMFANSGQVNSGPTPTFELIDFSNKTNVFVNGLGGADVITANLTNLPTGLTNLDILGDTSADDINILAVPSIDLDLFGGAGTDRITIGSIVGNFDNGTGTLAPVDATSITVTSGGDIHELRVDDSSNAAGSTYTQDPIVAGIGLSVTTPVLAGPINYTRANNTLFRLATGGGNDTIVVNATGPGDNGFDSNGGTDVIVVNDFGIGQLGPFAGGLQGTANLFDAGAGAGDRVLLNADEDDGTIIAMPTGAGAGTIGGTSFNAPVAYAGSETTELDGGFGQETFNIPATNTTAYRVDGQEINDGTGDILNFDAMGFQATQTPAAPAENGTISGPGFTTVTFENIEVVNILNNAPTPTITTVATATVPIGGGDISDVATLTGGAFPAVAPADGNGTVIFRLYGPQAVPAVADCTAAPVFTSAAVAVTRVNNTTGTATSPNFTPALAGTYRWIASYSGNSINFPVAGVCGDAGETSVVTQAQPTITTQASPNIVIGPPGSTITDNATVAGRVLAQGTGTVTFRLFGPDDATCATQIFSSTVPITAVDGPVTSAAFTPVLAGTYRWIASYSGDANNLPVAGACNDANESVLAQAATTTTITAPLAGTSTINQSTAFTATVVTNPAGGGVPTGTVTFTSNGANDVGCTTPALVAGTGTCNIVFGATPGARVITATYNPTIVAPATQQNFLTSSDTEGHTVIKANSTVDITAQVNEPSVVNETVTFTVQVTGNPAGATLPTGDVIISATGGAASETCTATIVQATGIGTCQIQFLSQGTRPITATYQGDVNFNASAPDADTQQVDASGTTTTVSTNPNPSVNGQAVTVNFTVTANQDGPTRPAGTVTVTSSNAGDNVTGCVARPLTGSTPPAASSASGSCMITFASGGTRTLTATFTPSNTNFTGSAGTVNHVVNPAAITVNIFSDNPDPSRSGESVTVVVDLTTTTPGAGSPTGTVNVSFSGGGETCQITTFTTTGANTSRGSCMVALTNIGQRTITATFVNNANFAAAASDTELHQVIATNTTTVINTDTPDPSVVGGAVAVTFTVAPVTPGAGAPTGTVTVSAGGGAETCTDTLVAGDNGVGGCSITLLSAGSRPLTATFVSDSTNFNGSASTPATPHQVDAANTTTAITNVGTSTTANNATTSVVGQPVTVSYSVTAPAGAPAPTGQVQVVDTTTGAILCGPTALTAAGMAGNTSTGSCQVTFTSPGTRTLQAQYLGSANYNTSNSTPPITFVVGKADTTTTIGQVSAGNTSGQGTTLTVPVTVAPVAPGAGAPTGAVNVTVDGGTESCTFTLTAANNGQGSCQIIGGIAPGGGGPRTIRATYVGDANFNGSVGTRAHTGTVTISGTILQNNAPNASTPLSMVTVELRNVGQAPGTPALQTVTTGANGMFAFPGLTVGQNYVVTPSRAGFVFSPTDRTYNNLQTNVTNADFTAFAGQIQRNLTIGSVFTNGPFPGTVMVPVTLNSLGNERRINFSATFGAPLSNPVATCTAAALALGCTLVQNNTVAGAVGVAVTLTQAPAAGQIQLLNLTFTTAANSGSFANAPVLFSDNPTPRATFDAAGNPLATTYTSGIVVFAGTGRGFEGDVATRFNGDAQYRSNDVEQERRFVSNIDQPNGATNEFERADTAPFATRGDGRLRADDFQQVVNYVAGLYPGAPGLIPADGPDGPIFAAPSIFEERERKSDSSRVARVLSATAGAGNKVTVAVEFDAAGDEVVSLFTLNFDPSLLGNPEVKLADGMNAGTMLTVNSTNAKDGQLTILLDSATALAATRGQRVVTITFDVSAKASGETRISFGDSGSFADAQANDLRATFEDGVITITGRKSR